MKTFFLTFIIGVVGIVAFNVATDPWRRWRPGDFGIKDGWPAGMVLSTPANFNERGFKVSQSKAVAALGILVLGNSHANMIDAGMFPAGLGFFNGWISSAFFVEYISIWQTFKDRGKSPRWLIIVADPKLLNKAENQYDWLSQTGLYRRFIMRSLAARPELWALWVRLLGRGAYGFVHEAAQQMNRQMLEDSVKYWVAKARSGSKREFYFVEEEKLPREETGRRSDGSMIYPAVLSRKSPEEFRDLAQLHVLAKRGTPYSYAFDTDTLATLDALIKEASAGGTRVMIVRTPLQQALFDVRAPTAVYVQMMERFEAALKGLSEENPSLAICDMVDPVKAGCTEVEFVDPDHPARACVQKVITRCLASSVSWRALL